MAFRQYIAKLTGITPLIMHWDNIDWADQISLMRTEIKQKDKANFSAGDDRCPPDTWKGCLYNDEQFVTIPTDNLRKCLVKAGAKVSLKNQETFKKAMASGVVFDSTFAEFFINGKPLKIADCTNVKGKFADQATNVKKLGFKLMVKRASVGAAKHVRVRPEFANWTATASFTITEDRITEDALKEIWTGAGLYVGLCDWRPDSPKSPGPYGKFSVELKLV